MGVNLSGMFANFAPILLSLLLVVAGGILMSRERTHAVLAHWCLRVGVVVGGYYPIWWARTLAPDAETWKWVFGVGLCGALLGLGYYGAGLWYRRASPHNMPEDYSGKIPDEYDSEK